MQGRVIFLVRPGQHGDLGHPNAVVIELSPDQFLCVTGFTPGKLNYEAAKQAEFQLGIWQFSVEIDHAKCLAASPQAPIDLHVCGYVFQTAQIISLAELRSGRDWGSLPDSELRQIANGLLTREAQRPYLPKNAVRLLRQFLGR